MMAEKNKETVRRAVVWRKCESCGNKTRRTTAMLPRGFGGGLAVCPKCVTGLMALKWEKL